MDLTLYQDVGKYLREVPLPELVLLRQHFARPRVAALDEAVAAALATVPALDTLPPGARIAITVGSRGIADIALIVRSLVTALRERGADPFIIPAMGSHGGATAGGQQEVLASLGVTEERVGAAIISSLEVDELGMLPNGMRVSIDRAAHAADGIIAVNRIKPHTDFTASIESGLAKMIAIGLGKHAGAITVHSWGIEGLTQHIAEVAQYTIARTNVLFGLGIIENAYDEVAEIVAVPRQEIGREQEEGLLRKAKSLMARLPWDELDVLIVDQIGKNISGAGMDTNIVGRMRFAPEPKPTAATITSLVALDLTDESHGNGIGLGFADFTTQKLIKKIDFQDFYINALTAGVIATNSAKLPMILPTEREAVAAAIRMCGRPDQRQARLARIQNTLRLEYVLASPAALPYLRPSSEVDVLGPPRPFALQADGALTPFAEARARGSSS